MELKIKYLSTAVLIPYAQNARTHSDQQISQIADSIGEFGFNNPVLIDGEKGVIAGHGQAVYEPFCGSGTTIIAAEMAGRLCHAIELNPTYVDIAVKRWQDFTGQQATLDGKTYDEISSLREAA